MAVTLSDLWLFPAHITSSVLLFPGIVTMLFVYLLGYNAQKVADARRAFKIAPPATSGHPDFERVFRAQMNTIEFVVMVLPTVWLFGIFTSPILCLPLGAAWVYARRLYTDGYAAEATQRFRPFYLSLRISYVFFIGAVIGMARQFVALLFGI